jgi:phosphate acetyltransferase
MLMTTTMQTAQSPIVPGLEAWPRLAQLLERARYKGGVPTGVVYPLSEQALRAACDAHRWGLMQAVLYGPSDRIHELAVLYGIDLSAMEVVDTEDEPLVCAQQAVADCKSGVLKALMKGSLHTDQLLTAVVARHAGIRTRRRMSHMFVFDVPAYHKLLIVSDAVVNIAPSLKSKKSIVQNSINAALKLGIDNPKVAVLAAVESLHAAISATSDAAALVEMVHTGEITGGLLSGPLGFDNAVSAHAAKIKGIDSVVAGDADILIAPDLNAGNILYKSLIYMARAECAGVVLGTTVPVILTSRADSETSRIASCALASLLA